MGNVGRFFCVALPFILTTASIICMLIVGLVGVTNSPNLYMFEVNVTKLEIDPTTIESLASKLGISSRSPVKYHTALSALSSSSSSSSSSADTLTTNITAADLGLADVYEVNLWGYCTVDSDGTRTCTKSKFDWASTYLNTTSLTSVGTDAGLNITLPSTISDSLKAFKEVTKWTEIVYIIAMLSLGIELLVGLFSYCSRAVSCITYIISGIATIFVCGAAVLMTVMAAVVIGAVEGTAKWYGVTGSIDTKFLAVVWLGAAFSIASGLFWLFSCCCCKRDHHTSRRGRDDEKPFLPAGGSGYAPLGENRASYGYNNPAYGAPRHQGNARSDLAYEPYSHSNV
ncbi:SUR7/PalI family-domain-containing protein [Xylariales sp. PMI_506]|nr:SUR7/PalI family-domain-containing protein [Xylariales sp. PMI_506]